MREKEWSTNKANDTANEKWAKKEMSKSEVAFSRSIADTKKLSPQEKSKQRVKFHVCTRSPFRHDAKDPYTIVDDINKLANIGQIGEAFIYGVKNRNYYQTVTNNATVYQC